MPAIPIYVILLRVEGGVGEPSGWNTQSEVYESFGGGDAGPAPCCLCKEFVEKLCVLE